MIAAAIPYERTLLNNMETISVMNNPQGNTVSEVGASTPGPWKIYDDDDDLRVKILGVRPDTGNAHVATVLGKANAHQIAAVPDMLAELKMLYARHGYQSTADVIAKATGTTDTHRDSVNEQRAERK